MLIVDLQENFHDTTATLSYENITPIEKNMFEFENAVKDLMVMEEVFE